MLNWKLAVFPKQMHTTPNQLNNTQGELERTAKEKNEEKDLYFVW